MNFNPPDFPRAAIVFADTRHLPHAVVVAAVAHASASRPAAGGGAGPPPPPHKDEAGRETGGAPACAVLLSTQRPTAAH